MTIDRWRGACHRLLTHYGWRGIRALDRVFAHQSLVPDVPVFDNRRFAFVDAFTADWETIRDEVVEILRHRDAIPAFHEISPEQRHISTGDSWRTFLLFGFGTKLNQNCSHAPRTTTLLERVPGLENAWFSILAPGYHIPAHTGVSKGILRVHLGLLVPSDASQCRMRVDGQIRAWHPGELLVFDDTYEHEVWNDTAEERVVLVFDVDRPMRPLGRFLNRLFLQLVKLSSFYREPQRRMAVFERRYDVAASVQKNGRDVVSGPSPASSRSPAHS